MKRRQELGHPPRPLLSALRCRCEVAASKPPAPVAGRASEEHGSIGATGRACCRLVRVGLSPSPRTAQPADLHGATWPLVRWRRPRRRRRRWGSTQTPTSLAKNSSQRGSDGPLAKGPPTRSSVKSGQTRTARARSIRLVEEKFRPPRSLARSVPWRSSGFLSKKPGACGCDCDLNPAIRIAIPLRVGSAAVALEVARQLLGCGAAVSLDLRGAP
jgi:hypothetical protein